MKIELSPDVLEKYTPTPDGKLETTSSINLPSLTITSTVWILAKYKDRKDVLRKGEIRMLEEMMAKLLYKVLDWGSETEEEKLDIISDILLLLSERGPMLKDSLNRALD